MNMKRVMCIFHVYQMRKCHIPFGPNADLVVFDNSLQASMFL